MKTYTASVDVTPAATTTPDDALAVAVQAVNALTVVESSSALRVGGGIVNLRLKFYGLNDNEARETVRQTYAALRTTGGVISAVEPIVLAGVNT